TDEPQSRSGVRIDDQGRGCYLDISLACPRNRERYTLTPASSWTGHVYSLPTTVCAGIVMTNVLHHLSRPRLCLPEATRWCTNRWCGAMIKPWFTQWSPFVYTQFHHEPYDPDISTGELPSSGLLSGANDALPWIIFSD